VGASKAVVSFAFVSVVAACGARTGLDVLHDGGVADATIDVQPPHDAQPDVLFPPPDATPDVAVPDANVLCSDGYFVEVIDSNGTTLYQNGCQPLPVPEKTCAELGEDCLATAIEACNDGGEPILLAFKGECFCSTLQVGSASAEAVFGAGPGAAVGGGTVDVTAVGVSAATGDYDTTVTPADGGAPFQLHGTFCVHP